MPFLVATAHRAAVAVAPVSASTGVSSASRAVKGGAALWVTLATLKKYEACYKPYYTSDSCNTKWQLVAILDALGQMSIEELMHV
eukprot:1430449-Pleurochrysis_carterae.AAC.1